MKRVLLLHQELASRPFRTKFNAAFVAAMRAGERAPIDVYEEAIESERFPGPQQLRLATEYLRKKYAGHPIDVIVVVGNRALAFARENRDMFGNPAIVAAASNASMIGAGDDNITGFQGGPWIEGTIDLALTMLPDTQRVFVVDGTRDNDGAIQADIERQLLRRRATLTLVYLRDLSAPDLVAQISAVPERSIVLFVRQTMRSASADLDPFEGLALVAQASRVPVFSQMEEFVGRGVLGGSMWRYEDDARRMADMAKMIVRGAAARDIPPGRTTFMNLVDWRELERWRIPVERIPAASVVANRPRSFFQLYRRYAVGGAIVIAAQLVLIVGLLVERRWRRRAERDSRTSKDRYQSVVDTQSELICRFLPDTTLTFVNDAYCRFCSQPRDQLLGRRFAELIPESSRPGVLDRIARLTSGSDSHEHQVSLPDGTVGWHHWINHAIVDERGRLIELQGVGRDITDRKRAEEAVGQLEARNSAMLRAIPDLMFVMLRDGTYVDFHARDPNLLFVAPNRFIGRTVRDAMPAEAADLIMDALERAFESHDAVVVEYELQMDELRHYEARLVRADADTVLTIVRDVTESRRAHDLNRNLAGRLLASQEQERTRIARDLHDGICQDVAALSVDIGHLRRTGGDIQTQAVQETLLSVERRTATVAENLRLMSHGLHPSVLQHVGLIAALQAHCAEVERQHQVHIRFFAEDDVEPARGLAALSLFRITQEALRNAVRHGNARHATVSMTRGRKHLVLSVSDDGRGFDPAVARRKDGLGLLSIEERARLVQGHVIIRSVLGRGTTIEVRVPIAVVDREPEHVEQQRRYQRPSNQEIDFK